MSDEVSNTVSNDFQFLEQENEKSNPSPPKSLNPQKTERSYGKLLENSKPKISELLLLESDQDLQKNFHLKELYRGKLPLLSKIIFKCLLKKLQVKEAFINLLIFSALKSKGIQKFKIVNESNTQIISTQKNNEAYLIQAVCVLRHALLIKKNFSVIKIQKLNRKKKKKINNMIGNSELRIGLFKKFQYNKFFSFLKSKKMNLSSSTIKKQKNLLKIAHIRNLKKLFSKYLRSHLINFKEKCENKRKLYQDFVNKLNSVATPHLRFTLKLIFDIEKNKKMTGLIVKSLSNNYINVIESTISRWLFFVKGISCEKKIKMIERLQRIQNLFEKVTKSSMKLYLNRIVLSEKKIVIKIVDKMYLNLYLNKIKTMNDWKNYVRLMINIEEFKKKINKEKATENLFLLLLKKHKNVFGDIKTNKLVVNTRKNRFNFKKFGKIHIILMLFMMFFAYLAYFQY